MVGKGWELSNTRRFAVLGAALLLCQYAAVAMADPTPRPDPVDAATVVCPSNEVVANALGRQATTTLSNERECQYSASGAGVVRFLLEDRTLEQLRAEAEARGSEITPVPDLAPDAFAEAIGNSWVMRFPLGATAASLAVPPVLQSGAVALAEEMLAAVVPASSASPAPAATPDRPGMPHTGN